MKLRVATAAAVAPQNPQTQNLGRTLNTKLTSRFLGDSILTISAVHHLRVTFHLIVKVVAVFLEKTGKCVTTSCPGAII